MHAVVTLEGDMPMTNRNLTRRLERLEARLLPSSEEQIHIVRFISSDGEIVGTEAFRQSIDRRPIKRNRRWR
jgi:hypothetical protein